MSLLIDFFVLICVVGLVHERNKVIFDNEIEKYF